MDMMGAAKHLPRVPGLQHEHVGFRGAFAARARSGPSSYRSFIEGMKSETPPCRSHSISDFICRSRQTISYFTRSSRYALVQRGEPC